MASADPHGWRQEGRDLVRGIAAGSIVGVPLIYTMEMWWHGMALPPWGLVAILFATLGLNVVFEMLSGFRKHYTFLDAVADAISAVAVALLLAAAMLALVAEWQHPMAETVMAYAVTLLVSLVLLRLVGVPGAMASLDSTVRSVVVLGFPAVIGASAGRLI